MLRITFARFGELFFGVVRCRLAERFRFQQLAFDDVGYLYKEIAESLRIGMTTVNTHVRRSFEKLQVHSRSQAVAKFKYFPNGAVAK
jgi:ATP/maltotriose-dependent transcriptional regulator MalT